MKDLEQRLRNLRSGEIITEYDELAEQVDQHEEAELENVYHDSTLWIEKWKTPAVKVVVSYQEGTGIMVRGVREVVEQ